MIETIAPASAPCSVRIRPWAVVLLLATWALALLVVTVSYGLSLEYSDTAAPDLRIAARSFVDWGIGVALVGGTACGAVAAARRSRGRRALVVAAGLAVMVTLAGVPTGAVLGAHHKLDRYPDLPSCADDFDSGPAVPIVRAAQAGFAELDHPGPFSGGGSSGIDGCSSQLMVDDDLDVVSAYRETLLDSGWRIIEETSGQLSAAKDGQRFETSRGPDDSWWVWIGPDGGAPRAPQD